MTSFNDLAREYVLSDSAQEARSAAERAAAAIEGASTTNLRIPIAQWVASINPWMPRGRDSTDDEDDDIVARAKALEFLASTLEVLKKDTLKADQVKLLISFFCSLFSNDHRAGITASAKALRQLVGMKSFQPASGDDIITDLTKLGEDFKRQVPSTRLEIYELTLGLLCNTDVAEELSYKHGNTCGFMTGLLDLFRSERDPQNLIKWFDIQRTFLQSFSPIPEVAAEVFKAFSSYFPITLRASATPSGITVDDLKGALRSCFAAHYRIADLTIPFLISKLDQGEAVTVSVKVDILQTLEACLSQYEHVKKGVVPFAEQVWASLKYEVRNGEIQDAIEATLKTIGTLARRLDESDLKDFITTAWRDLNDDLANPTYAAQAGQLLAAIAGASSQSFSLATPQTLSRIKDSLKHTKSVAHQAELLSLLNSLLRIRSTLLGSQTSTGPLQDDLFGDTLFDEVYSKLWKNPDNSTPISQQVSITKKSMDGIASLAIQYSGGADSRPLCSEHVRENIFAWLGSAAIIDPLEGKSFLEGSDSTEEEDLCSTATQNLKRVAPVYPRGYQHLLRQFLASTKSSAAAGRSSGADADEIFSVATRLSVIGCSSVTSSGDSPLVNSISTVHVLLEGLQKSAELPIAYLAAIVDSIHLAIVTSLRLFQAGGKSEDSKAVTQASAWYLKLKSSIDGLPEVDVGQLGDLGMVSKSLERIGGDASQAFTLFLGYSLFVVAQIYRRFTTIKPLTGNALAPSTKQWATSLSSDFDGQTGDLVPLQDHLLNQIGQLATTVVSHFTEQDQNELLVEREAIVMFRGDVPTEDGVDLWRSAMRSDSTDASERKSVGLSPLDEFRTAPLARGILQGLYPGAMRGLYSFGTLPLLCDVLTRPQSLCSATARVSLDTILTILSNKFPTAQESDEWERSVQSIATGLQYVGGRTGGSSPDPTTSLAIFKSIMYFLAGDIARFRPGKIQNSLVERIFDQIPAEVTNGHELTQLLEILVSPKECFAKKYHAVFKRLSGQWFYNTTVRAKLDSCFSPPEVDDRTAKNRAVATFRILKHLKYAEYQSDVEQLVRIAIKSLTTFETNGDMASALQLLIQVLENEPEHLKGHIESLIAKTLDVYRTASSVTPDLELRDDPTATQSKKKEHEAIKCRVSGLYFLQQLAGGAFETRLLLTSKRAVSRGLALACGDRVREVRHMAIAARKAWSTLA